MKPSQLPSKVLAERRKVGTAAFLLLLAAAALLPFYLGTSTYPVTVVEGSSMYPNLQNGYLVVFTATNSLDIPNGTIVVYVQSQSGMPMLDSLTQPTIIHRVIDRVVQADGTVYYRTKGDNNQYPDPALVRSDHILGTPALVIPGAGLLILFVRSPQGLVATIGLVTLFYLGSYEAKMAESKRREGFLASLAEPLLNGEIPDDLFNKLEVAAKYSDGVKVDELKDAQSLAVVDWLKSGGLDRKWKLGRVRCDKCSHIAFVFSSDRDSLLVVCPYCSSREERRVGRLTEFAPAAAVSRVVQTAYTPEPAPPEPHPVREETASAQPVGGAGRVTAPAPVPVGIELSPKEPAPERGSESRDGKPRSESGGEVKSESVGEGPLVPPGEAPPSPIDAKAPAAPASPPQAVSPPPVPPATVQARVETTEGEAPRIRPGTLSTTPPPTKRPDQSGVPRLRLADSARLLALAVHRPIQIDASSVQSSFKGAVKVFLLPGGSVLIEDAKGNKSSVPLSGLQPQVLAKVVRATARVLVKSGDAKDWRPQRHSV